MAAEGRECEAETEERWSQLGQSVTIGCFPWWNWGHVAVTTFFALPFDVTHTFVQHLASSVRHAPLFYYGYLLFYIIREMRVDSVSLDVIQGFLGEFAKCSPV